MTTSRVANMELVPTYEYMLPRASVIRGFYRFGKGKSATYYIIIDIYLNDDKKKFLNSISIKLAPPEVKK